jgi:pyridoxal phosphate enzyme (YggS family)
MVDTGLLATRLNAVQNRIEQAANSAGRSVLEVALVVVTKGHPPDTLAALYQLGVRRFGESYVDEAINKQSALGQLKDVQWHMIGHVQSRKAANVAAKFDWVHSVDSLKLAKRMSSFAREANRNLPVLLELNVGGEASKYGWPANNDKAFNEKLDEIGQILELPNVRVRGLMSMAPMSSEPSQARSFFARTRTLRGELAARFPSVNWDQLSMGMSNDFEAAILEGSTMVRVGTAILGSRSKWSN